MIKRIPLKVEYVDGTIERALCTGADSIAFERTYDLGTDQVGKRLEYVWFLAWAALTRTGKVTRTFEEWLPTVEGVGDEPELHGSVPRQSVHPVRFIGRGSRDPVRFVADIRDRHPRHRLTEGITCDDQANPSESRVRGRHD